MDLSQQILDIMGDDEYPAGWIIEELRKKHRTTCTWDDLKRLAHMDILDIRMGTVTYMVRKRREIDSSD